MQQHSRTIRTQKIYHVGFNRICFSVYATTPHAHRSLATSSLSNYSLCRLLTTCRSLLIKSTVVSRELSHFIHFNSIIESRKLHQEESGKYIYEYSWHTNCTISLTAQNFRGTSVVHPALKCLHPKDCIFRAVGFRLQLPMSVRKNSPGHPNRFCQNASI